MSLWTLLVSLTGQTWAAECMAFQSIPGIAQGTNRDIWAGIAFPRITGTFPFPFLRARLLPESPFGHSLQHYQPVHHFALQRRMSFGPSFLGWCMCNAKYTFSCRVHSTFGRTTNWYYLSHCMQLSAKLDQCCIHSIVPKPYGLHQYICAT